MASGGEKMFDGEVFAQVLVKYKISAKCYIENLKLYDKLLQILIEIFLFFPWRFYKNFLDTSSNFSRKFS